MTTGRPKPTPEQITEFHETLDKLTYQEVWSCANGDGVVIDTYRMYWGPDGLPYHSRECASERALAQEFNCQIGGTE